MMKEFFGKFFHRRGPENPEKLLFDKWVEGYIKNPRELGLETKLNKAIKVLEHSGYTPTKVCKRTDREIYIGLQKEQNSRVVTESICIIRNRIGCGGVKWSKEPSEFYLCIANNSPDPLLIYTNLPTIHEDSNLEKYDCEKLKNKNYVRISLKPLLTSYMDGSL